VSNVRRNLRRAVLALQESAEKAHGFGHADESASFAHGSAPVRIRAPFPVVLRYNYIMRKTFKYRLLPTAAQERALRTTLDECQWLYNHLLERRKTSYEERGETLTLYEQQATLGALKAARPALAVVHSQVLQVRFVSPKLVAHNHQGTGR